jgi:transcriptional regulator GlxA family with amidase domain
MPGHLPSDGRRRFLTGGAAGLAALWATETARSAALATDASVSLDQPAPAGRLTPPPRGPIPVAFVISNGATVIDFTGPWEVFQDVMIPDRGPSHDEDQMPFRLFTVADGPAPVRVTGGMQIVPDHTVDDAPAPRVIVIPAHRSSPKMLEWIRKASATADMTMSVCTGAFPLARTGLLAGRSATTHHDFLDALAREFPDVRVERGRRFVESDRIATAGGLTSGMDLALRVVERYFGRPVAQTTADYMEYQGTGWRV